MTTQTISAFIYLVVNIIILSLAASAIDMKDTIVVILYTAGAIFWIACTSCLLILAEGYIKLTKQVN